MPRKGHAAERDVLPDPVYSPKVATELISNVMGDGKKGVAQKICYDAFQIINERTSRDAMEIFEETMNNIMPLLGVKAGKTGGASYQALIEVRPERRQTLGSRWLLAVSKGRSGKYMRERLVGELMDAVNNAGAAVKKREDTHKMAETSRAFAHYRY